MSTKKLQLINSVVTTDETLTQSGVAADAKATGDAIAAIDELVGDESVASQITQAIETNLTGYATETYVDTKVANLVDSAPETLNTLNELSAALGDDPNFATTVATQIGNKADKEHTHAISDVVDLQTSLDAKVPTTRTVNGKALSTDITLSASDVGADASGSADTALTSAKTYTDQQIDSFVGDTSVANQINTAVAGYLPLTGGTVTGTVNFEPQNSSNEGGEIHLSAPSGNTALNGIILDNCNGEFRIFGVPSADGTTRTGTGDPLIIDPYDKTIASSNGGYTFYANKYVVNSVVSMEYDSTNECLNFVFN